MPKVDSAKDVQIVDQFVEKYGLDGTKRSLRIIASIESPMALLNLREVSPASLSLSRARADQRKSSFSQIATSSPRISSLLVSVTYILQYLSLRLTPHGVVYSSRQKITALPRTSFEHRPEGRCYLLAVLS